MKDHYIESGIGSLGHVLPQPYLPLRDLSDIELIERTPLEQRIQRWDFAANLLDGCRHAPEKPALIATRNGDVEGLQVVWSFAELERQATKAANMLRARGIGPNDAVAIIAPTVPALYAALFACLLAARPFPINWMLNADAIRDLLLRAEVKAVVTLGPTDGFAIYDTVHQAVAGLMRRPLVFTLHDPFGDPRPDDLLAAASPYEGEKLLFERAPGPNDIAAYVHSGGTTGHPKVVRITQRGLVYRQWATNIGLALTSADVTLSDTPLFHMGGLCARGLVPIANGMTSILPSMHGARDKAYIASYWRYVEKFGVTQISGVPTTLSVLAKSPPTTEDITSLRPYFLTGSSPMPPAVQERLGAIAGTRALVTYGMTESTGHAAMDPRDGVAKPRYSGLRAPYTSLRIAMMQDGRVVRDCDVDEVGMVLIRGPGVGAGYLDPEQNHGVFLTDGFLVTGDLGSIDAQGYLRIVGRHKDLIIRGGHNIEPGLIENALLQSPWIAQCAAIGKPDAHAGELPIAYVELHPGVSATPSQLLDYVATRIAERPAVPKEIIILDKLPLTAVGKPVKHELQVRAAQKVFEEALHEVPGQWELEVTTTAGSGLALKVTIRESAPESRRRIESILSAFHTPYTIVET